MLLVHALYNIITTTGSELLPHEIHQQAKWH
jgi:hypothetical protein